MGSVGTGYDLAVSTYSPDGRIFQVEYANKAVDNSGTIVGVVVKDGCVLGLEKLIQTKLLVKETNRRIQSADAHIGMASAGLLPDCRHMLNQARDEAKKYRNNFNEPISGKMLANNMGLFVEAYTLYSSVRPFGTTAIFASMDRYNGPQMHMIEPSGVYWGYHGCAAGKGKQVAKTEIEKLDLKNMTARQAVKEVARILYFAHDESKDREFELELSWVCEESDMRHQHVPTDLYNEAVQFAQESQNDEMED